MLIFHPMRRIGRYEIEKELGRGSMGVVYLARDPRVLRQVALKTYRLPEGLSQDEEREFKERFLREAQAAGALSHPAIVTVHDADEDPRGVPYIAMEYVAGQSLRELLADEGKLGVERAFEMAEALADALNAAHAAGVVHRDIKPANILVREQDGAFKLTDFGVARFTCSELTRSGLTLGSPVYMSPEQISGKTVDGRSDLFSLAIVLYLALSGKRPFDRSDLTALAYAVVHETPIPITRQVPDLPCGMDEFMDRALAKDPAQRFPDGTAFLQALTTLRRGTGAAELEATVVESAGTTERHHAAHRFLGKGRIFVALVFLVGILLAWTGWSQSRRATVIIEGHNAFEDATLTLLVDGEEHYTRDLVAQRKSARMFGKKLFKYGKETFEASLDLSPGRHRMVARVVRAEDDRVFEDKLTVKLEAGETARLKLISKPSLITGVTLEPD